MRRVSVACLVVCALLAGVVIAPDEPGSACADALELADALNTQHHLVLDHVRGARSGDHATSVRASIAGQAALDAYGWTETAYNAAADSCKVPT